MIDSYTLTECPNCKQDLTSLSPTGEQQIRCNLKNEGGFQEGLDILPILTEETYLKAYPEERKCQAFLEFCGTGDVEAMIDLLYGDEKNENEGDILDVLRYQDNIRTMNSGLHVAVHNQKTEIAWILLMLASSLKTSEFPRELLTLADRHGLQRPFEDVKPDIRSLKDIEGKTAEQRAAAIGGIWEDWVSSGRLKPPS